MTSHISLPPVSFRNQRHAIRTARHVTEETANEGRRFVQTALRVGMLSAEQAKRIIDYTQMRNVTQADAALQLSIMNNGQVAAVVQLTQPLDLAPGYHLTGLIGHGAVGVVYRATQLNLDREVAIKAIGSTRKANQNAAERMQREANAIARLSHPHIVTAYDCGVHDGSFYIVMELVEGQDLASYIIEQPRIPERTAWLIARQIASALAHANENGLIHRDIKPANILLTDRPVGSNVAAGIPFAKVADFGLALTFGESGMDSNLTLEGTTLGTPAYVAPEQLGDTHVDLRADIYSLGATVFHLLCGYSPFIDSSPMQAIISKTTGDDLWRDELHGNVSPASERLFRDMTESDIDERVPDYNTLLERIDDVLATLDRDETYGATETRALHGEETRPGPTAAVSTAVSTVDYVAREAAQQATREVASSSWQDRVAQRARSFSPVVAIAIFLITLVLASGYLITSSLKATSVASSTAETADRSMIVPTLDWVPVTSPQFLFNGRSTPRFRQSGIMTPGKGTEGERVLVAQEGAWMIWPIQPDKMQGSASRLRISVRAGEAGEIDVTLPAGEASEVASGERTLHLSTTVARLTGPSSSSTEIDLRASRDGEFPLQQLQFLQHDGTFAAYVNGQLVDAYAMSPESDRSVRITATRGEIQFADIDVVEIHAP